MSANDGGDPIRLSKAPLPRPVIPRGRTLVPKVALPMVPPRPGELGTFFWRRGGFDLTFYNVRAIDEVGGDIVFDVTPDTVVTWEIAPKVD